MSGLESLKEAAKEKARKKGHNLLNKWFGSDSKPEVPPKPEAKPPKTTDEDRITASLNQLRISGQKPPSNGPNSFVGGFYPGVSPVYGSSSLGVPTHHGSHAASAPNLPKPGQIPMPTPFTDYPQSVTMQMALMPEESISTATFHRPHSNPEVATTSTKLSASPSPKPSSSKINSPNPRPGAVPLIPIKGHKKRCSGVTKAGKRCNRMVKVRPSLLHFMSENESEEAVHVYCFQHEKEVLSPTGFYSHENHEFVQFEEWIPSHLQPETQAALRVEMEKPRSQSDVHGYIYCYEIRDDNKETVKLKVGRTVNLVKRIDQWGKQCGSKEPILRGRYPPLANDGQATSLMKGVVKAGEKSKWCHRLERLIHLELSDLVSSAVYLNPAWPNIDLSGTSTPSGKQPSSSKLGSSKELTIKRCADCGSLHKEIFEFQRWKTGPNKGKEWDLLVKPIIERWGQFIEIYL
ncbi:hypothetical protein CPC08DRAFT_626509 [Agrocybe pediades]|nr:hypothetical protein CPC08DRAFT_626509 [Agrocybe pediades]